MAIQYPINLETDRFTVYDTNTSQPIVDGNGRPKVGVKWGSKDVTQMIPNLSTNIKWLIEVKETSPAYDAATQKLSKVKIYDVEAQTATDGWEVIDLTQAEIDAKIPPHYETSISTIKLDISEQSQNAFTRMMTFVLQAGMADTDEVTIKDCLSVSHTLTVAQFKTDMIEYGTHCYTLFNS